MKSDKKRQKSSLEIVEVGAGELATVASSKKDKKRQKLNLEVVDVEGTDVAPYVAYFPSGTRPTAHAQCHALSGSEELGDAALDFRAYRNSAPFKSSQQILVAVPAGANDEPTGVDYVARNFGAESGASASAPCHYALGVVDRNSGGIRLIPIAGDRIMRMNARVRGLEYKDDHKDAAEDFKRKADTPEERAKRRAELLQDFGNKKNKTKLQKAQRGHVSLEALSDADAVRGILETATEGQVLARDIEAEAAVARNLPPYDLGASRAEDVYPVGQLIPPEDWVELKTHDLTKAAVNEKHRQQLWDAGAYPAYVFNRLGRLRVADDSDGNKTRAHCLEYLTALLKLYQAPPARLKGKPGQGPSQVLDDVSHALGLPRGSVERMLRRFMERVEGPEDDDMGKPSKHKPMLKDDAELAAGPVIRFLRPKAKGDLLVSYMLALSLVVDGYTGIDPADMCKELKMTPSQLLARYKELGCTYKKLTAAQKQKLEAAGSSAEQVYEVSLKVPLTFPLAKKGKR